MRAQVEIAARLEEKYKQSERRKRASEEKRRQEYEEKCSTLQSAPQKRSQESVEPREDVWCEEVHERSEGAVSRHQQRRYEVEVPEVLICQEVSEPEPEEDREVHTLELQQSLKAGAKHVQEPSNKYITCYVCARQFSMRSFPVHEKSCRSKLEAQIRLLPEDQKKALPSRPSAIEAIFPPLKTSSTRRGGGEDLSSESSSEEDNTQAWGAPPALPSHVEAPRKRSTTPRKGASAYKGPVTIACYLCDKQFSIKSLEVNKPNNLISRIPTPHGNHLTLNANLRYMKNHAARPQSSLMLSKHQRRVRNLTSFQAVLQLWTSFGRVRVV